MRYQNLENQFIQLQNMPACRAFLCVIAGIFFWHSLAVADTGLNCAVLVSQKIRPYLQVVDGIIKEAGNAPNTVEVFYLTPGDAQNNQGLIHDVGQQGVDTVLAIGPEAASLVWKFDLTIRRLYAAILDPAAILGIDAHACGISLRIPVEDQLNSISKTLPSLKKLGLMFDPVHNQPFYEAATAASIAAGIEIHPIRIFRRSQITKVWAGLDVEAIWMVPDQTIISEKIVQYVIKEGVYRNIGVIGYNSFFVRSGAVFSFEFDYRDLGRQAGLKMLRAGSGNGCTPEPPVFDIRVNRKIAEKIGMEVGP